jgi:hypothetical protein
VVGILIVGDFPRLWGRFVANKVKVWFDAEAMLQRFPKRRNQTDMVSFRCLAGLMNLFAVLVHSSAAEPKPLLDPNDLPPYPSADPPEVLTHSQRNARQLLGGVTPSPANADADEQALAKAVDDLINQLDAAEAKAYRDDPALLLSDTYQGKAHEWVMDRHGAEFNASLKFSKNTKTKEDQTRMSKVVDLIDMILFVELANDPNFRPIFASFYDAADLMRKTNKTGFQDFYHHTRNDKLIGYISESQSRSISSLEEHLGELHKRYPLLLAKLEELKTEAAIPPDVFAGIKFGELYRLLDGMAQNAVLMRTPKEVEDLRQKLRTKVIQLANLRAKQQQRPANP